MCNHIELQRSLNNSKLEKKSHSKIRSKAPSLDEIRIAYPKNRKSEPLFLKYPIVVVSFLEY